MSTLTFAQVQVLLDQLTESSLVAYPLLYDNQDDSALSAGTVSYIKQKVLFGQARQFELGNPDRGRLYGSILLRLHERRGLGSAGRNAMLQAVVSSFRSKAVGGVTLLNARIVNQGETGNWNVTSVEIPFFWTNT